MQPTQLLYLMHFDREACEAHLVRQEKFEDNREVVTLDRTCFYPRGGGQDWDLGIIKSVDGRTVFDVEEVRLTEIGTVAHIGTYQSGQFSIGVTVLCAVNIERRRLNTRLHSAGHVIDLAVTRLGLPWIPGRGAHYPHMSFVEYEGEIEPVEIDGINSRLQETIDRLIAKGSHNEIRFMPISDMYTVCRHVPTNIPTNKPARVVLYAPDFGIPCGGTHVLDIHELGQVIITKIKAKKNLIKVSYSIEGTAC